MSVSRVVIPVLDIEQNDDPIAKVVVKGAKQLSSQVITASSANGDGATFSFQPPSQNTVLDRRIDIVIPLRIYSTDANARFNPKQCANDPTATCGFESSTTMVPPDGVWAGAVQPTQAQLASNKVYRMSNNLAPRQMPLANLISNIDLTINGTHFTTDINTYYKTLLQYTTPEWREEHLVSSYHHPDTYAGMLDGGYQDMYKDSATAGCKGVVNPLDTYSSGGRKGETPRGVFFNGLGVGGSGASAGNVVGQGGALGARVPKAFGETDLTAIDFYCVEPLMISPLLMSFGKGMSNINNIEVSVRYRQDLTTCFSYWFDGAVFSPTMANADTQPQVNNIAVAVGSVGGEFSAPPQLIVRNYTAQDDIRIPNEIVLPYYQPKRFLSNITGGGNQALNVSLTCNNRRLDQIPQSLYLTVKPEFSAEAVWKPNYFGDITNVSIQFGNQVGILSGHNHQQLIELAVENGCDIDGAQEARQRGYALKLDFGKDIPLQNNESPGTRGDYNIQVTITFNNPSGEAVQLVLEEMYVNVGTAVIAPNECRIQTGLLDLQDNVEAVDMGHKFKGGGEGDMMGGSLWGTLGRWASKAGHLVKSGASKVKALLPHIHKAVAMASDVANATGVGLDLVNKAQGVAQQAQDTFGGSISGGSLVGGGRPYRSRRH